MFLSTTAATSLAGHAMAHLQRAACQATTVSKRHYRKHRYATPRIYSNLAKGYIHGRDDNTQFKVEGVSDKMYPIKLDWVRPERIKRRTPQGSGDLMGLPDVDLSRHPLK